MSNQPAWMEELHKAMELLEQGHPENCLTALHAMLQDHGEDELCRAIVFDGMGRALFVAKKPELGMEAFTESLNILKKLYAEKQISESLVQGALQNLAHANMQMSRLDESMRLGKEAVECAEKNGGPDSLETAQALFHLAAPYYEKKDYDEAERLLLQAKSIFEKHAEKTGEIPEQIGTCLNNLGRIYEEKDQIENGIAYHKRAVAVRRKLSNREDLAFSLGNLGVALASNGKFDEACTALRESLEIYKEIGKIHSEEAQAFMANLALFETAQQNAAAKKGGTK